MQYLKYSTIFVLILLCCYATGEMNKVAFQFPEFDYKENTKNVS